MLLQEELDELFGIQCLEGLTTDLDMTTSEGLQQYLQRRSERNPKSSIKKWYCQITIWDPKHKKNHYRPRRLILKVEFTVVASRKYEALAIAEVIQRKLAKGLSYERNIPLSHALKGTEQPVPCL